MRRSWFKKTAANKSVAPLSHSRSTNPHCFRCLSLLLLAVLSDIHGRVALADDQIFDLQELSVKGRVVASRLADFNGDQHVDLMMVTLEGIPPDELRTIHVYLGQEDGQFPTAASHSIAVPRWSSVYDVADLKETPGDELLLLRPDGVTIMSIAKVGAPQWDLPVSGPSTVGAASDERGFDALHMVYHDFGEQPWILVPQIGLISALSIDGTVLAQIEVGRRANYFLVPPAAPFSMESDLQLYFDAPKVAVGDVDGDGRNDIVTSNRHEIRVYLRAVNGTFPRQPSQRLALHFISQRDNARGSGSVATTARDIDDDGRLDLLITHVEGSFSDAVTTTYLFQNREGSWNLDEPDDVFVSDHALGSDLLLDIDNDKRLELVRIRQKFSVLEFIELLLTKEVDSQLMVHYLQPDNHFSTRPAIKRKISTGISFESFRPEGFLPPTGLDLNADGYMDFVSSINGKGIAVYLGGGKKPWAKRTSLQKFPSSGAIRFTDYDNDGLLDFVLFDPRKFDSVVRVGRNRGELPGSPTVHH